MPENVGEQMENQTLVIGIEEFAHCLGIGECAARDIVRSQNRPPGFWIGREYKVIRDEIPEWLKTLNGKKL